MTNPVGGTTNLHESSDSCRLQTAASYTKVWLIYNVLRETGCFQGVHLMHRRDYIQSMKYSNYYYYFINKSYTILQRKCCLLFSPNGEYCYKKIIMQKLVGFCSRCIYTEWDRGQEMHKNTTFAQQAGNPNEYHGRPVAHAPSRRFGVVHPHFPQAEYVTRSYCVWTINLGELQLQGLLL